MFDSACLLTYVIPDLQDRHVIILKIDNIYKNDVK
jgi:hypothetical protein